MNLFTTLRLRRAMADKREASHKFNRMSAMMAGALAYNMGADPLVCPYVLDTPEHRAWLGGWMMAFTRRNECHW